MAAVEVQAPAAEPAPALPDYVLNPNAVLQDQQAAWRYGRAPDYSKTRRFYYESKSSIFLLHSSIVFGLACFSRQAAPCMWVDLKNSPRGTLVFRNNLVRQMQMVPHALGMDVVLFSKNFKPIVTPDVQDPCLHARRKDSLSHELVLVHVLYLDVLELVAAS